MKNRLKQLRTEKGLTQEELGNQLGLANNTISRYETGSNEPTKSETWQALADYFNVSVPYLQGKILFIDLSEDEQRIFTDVLDVLITTTDNKAINVLEALLNSFKECYNILELHQKRNRKGNK